MALAKAQLKEILSRAGVDVDHIEGAAKEILEGHADSVNALREEISQLRADLATAKNAQKEVEDLNAQLAAEKEKTGKLEEAEKAYKESKKEFDQKQKESLDKYNALKTEHEQFKSDQQAREVKAAKTTALREILKDLNISEKGMALVEKYRSVDDIEFEEDGKTIKGADDLRKSLKEDWGDYIVKENVQGADTKNPLGAGGGAGGMTKKEIMAIKDTAQRQKAIHDNPHLFGIE